MYVHTNHGDKSQARALSTHGCRVWGLSYTFSYKYYRYSIYTIRTV